MTETQNVATYARIRPYNPAINEDKNLTAREKDGDKVLNQNGDRTDTYNFTRVYNMTTSTNDLFETGMKPLLDYKILQGITSIFIVYGQSGSGKSFTLIGEHGHLGVLPLSLQYLLDQTSVEKITICSIEAYGIKAAKIGFYDLVSQLETKKANPKTYDAYATKDNSRVNPGNAKTLEITKDNCLKIITELQEVSHMAPTLKNPHSSRGHTVYFAKVKMTDLEPVYFICIDLAGSEGQTALGTKDEFVNGLKLAMSKGKLKLNKRQLKNVEAMYKTRSLEAGCINNGLTQLQSIFGELIRKKISKSQGLGLRKVLSSFISLKSAYAILFTLSASANNNKVTRATLNFAKQTQLVKVDTQKAKKKIDKNKVIQELNALIQTLRDEMDGKNKKISELKKLVASGGGRASPLPSADNDHKTEITLDTDLSTDDMKQTSDLMLSPDIDQKTDDVFAKFDALTKEINEAEAEEAQWRVSEEDIQAGKLNEDDMKQIFDEFDEDKGGEIDAEELQNALKSMGKEFSMSEVNELIKEIDEDENGVVDFEEFKLMATKAWFVDAFQSRLVEQMQKALESAMMVSDDTDEKEDEFLEELQTEELIAEVKERKQTIMDLKDQIESMKAGGDIEALEEGDNDEILEEKEEIIDGLRGAMEDMQIEINGLKNGKSESDEKDKAQNAEIQRLVNEIESVRQEMRGKKAVWDKQKMELESKSDEVTGMSSAVEELKTKMSDMERVNAKLKGDMSGMVQESETLKTELQNLRNENDSKVSEMESVNNELSQDMTELRAEIENLKGENESMRHDHEILDLENNELKSTVSELENSLENTRNNRAKIETENMNELQSKNSALKERVTELENEFERVKDSLNGLSAENIALKDDVSELQNDLTLLTESKINMINECNQQLNLLRKGIIVYQNKASAAMKLPFKIDFKWQ